MASALAPLPALGGGWTLRRAIADPNDRAYTAAREGGPVIHLEIHPVPHHPLGACYPFGAHDLAIGLLLSDQPLGDHAVSGQTLVPGLLRELVPALFAADPRCRRIVAAPAEDDTPALLALEAGGFRRVTEADLPGGTVVLLAAEPPEVTQLSTALDDMPH